MFHDQPRITLGSLTFNGAQISRADLATLEKAGVVCKREKEGKPCLFKRITWAFCADCDHANGKAKQICKTPTSRAQKHRRRQS